MPNDYPLLDLKAALVDADRAMQDIAYLTEVLQSKTEGQYPPEAATLLANVAVMRDLLTNVFPPALLAAIREEQAEFDEQADRWETSNY